MNVRNFTLLALIVSTALTAAFGGWELPAQMGATMTVVQALRVFVPSLFTLSLSNPLLAARCDGDDPETLARAMKDALTQIKQKSADLDEIGKDMKGRMEKGEQFGEKLREDFDKMAESVNSLKLSYTELEQKAVAATQEVHKGIKSWGQQVVDTDAFKSFAGKSGQKTSMRCQIKQIDTVAAGGTAGSGLMRPSYHDGDLVRMPRTELTIEDLLPVINVDTSSIDYAKQTLRENNAAMVAEGTKKPYSNYKWESATAAVRTVAHLAKLTRQATMNAPRLIGEVDSELRYGLGLVKETQYLYGNGTAQNLHGIMPQATAFALPAGIEAGEIRFANRADVLRLVMLNIQQRGGFVDGFVLNPVDWALLELTKDENGGYMFAQPQSGLTPPSMWKQPVVATPAMAQDDFLAGGFKFGATVYRQLGVEVLISTENDTDFEDNLATMRAEEMIALGVKRGWTFEKGKFSTALGLLAPPPSGG
jgi:Phage capsid family.